MAGFVPAKELDVLHFKLNSLFRVFMLAFSSVFSYVQ